MTHNRHNSRERGYLDDSFKIFHLTGSLSDSVPLHYHEFKKIVICLNGNIGYFIEGKQYEIYPNDIILVNAGELHRPLIYDKNGYERIIIYLSDGFINSCDESDLGECFVNAHMNTPILSCKCPSNKAIIQTALSMTDSFCKKSIAVNTLQRCRLMEFLILLNDCFSFNAKKSSNLISENKSLTKLLNYINNNLTSNLTVDSLAEHVHLNKSYLMHMFKSETGYTLMEYITEKRLFLAKYLIRQGTSLTDSCFESGFNNYTSFYRAYRKHYGTSPRNISVKDSLDDIKPE